MRLLNQYYYIRKAQITLSPLHPHPLRCGGATPPTQRLQRPSARTTHGSFVSHLLISLFNRLTSPKVITWTHTHLHIKPPGSITVWALTKCIYHHPNCKTTGNHNGLIEQSTKHWQHRPLCPISYLVHHRIDFQMREKEPTHWFKKEINRQKKSGIYETHSK